MGNQRADETRARIHASRIVEYVDNPILWKREFDKYMKKLELERELEAFDKVPA